MIKINTAWHQLNTQRNRQRRVTLPTLGHRRDRCVYHKTTTVCNHMFTLILARFLGRSGGGLCRLASARNASATRWEWDWIIPFQPVVSMTSVAWLQTHSTQKLATPSTHSLLHLIHCAHFTSPSTDATWRQSTHWLPSMLLLLCQPRCVSSVNCVVIRNRYQ